MYPRLVLLLIIAFSTFHQVLPAQQKQQSRQSFRMTVPAKISVTVFAELPSRQGSETVTRNSEDAQANAVTSHLLLTSTVMTAVWFSSQPNDSVWSSTGRNNPIIVRSGSPASIELIAGDTKEMAGRFARLTIAPQW
ncbi:MAG: hypothetical protein KDA91_13145 [Planctomycetaceae bacterium]|nr:hypothetical protein [Planctomycetaceae bacterium]